MRPLFWCSPLVLLPALLVACDGGMSAVSDSAPAMIDADSDGWPEETDCDDNNPAIYPAALAPACDTTDYNCDGQPDGVDADGDGWLNCEECDDQSALASPELVEVCEDLADNDCDGTSNDCRLLGDFELRDAKAILTSWALGDGGAIAGAGDIDGDGVGDFVVGGWQAGVSDVSSEGAAYVVRGGDTFPHDLDDAWAVIDGTVPYDDFGRTVQGGTDLSGDGRPDIVADGDGVISVFTALVAGRTTVEERNSVVGDNSAYFTGLAGSGPAAGDVTGDGNADLVFGGYESEVASIDIVSGPVASDVGTGDWIARVVNDLNAGCSDLDGSGDLNADGIADIAVGCDALDIGEDGDEGGGFVMLGPLSGSYVASVDADATFVGETLRAYVGQELAIAGDLNADGFGDLAVGGRRDGTTSGVYVLSGPLSGRVDLANADAYITGESSGSSCIASAGDVDRDGRSDLLLGDSGAWLQYGPVSGRLTLAEADTVWSGDEDFYGGDGCAGLWGHHRRWRRRPARDVGQLLQLHDRTGLCARRRRALAAARRSKAAYSTATPPERAQTTRR